MRGHSPLKGGIALSGALLLLAVSDKVTLYMGRGDLLILGTRRKWVVCFTLQLLYLQGSSTPLPPSNK